MSRREMSPCRSQSRPPTIRPLRGRRRSAAPPSRPRGCLLLRRGPSVRTEADALALGTGVSGERRRSCRSVRAGLRRARARPGPRRRSTRARLPQRPFRPIVTPALRCHAMAAPVVKDQELELTIDSLAYGGNGVARLDGFVVFVRRGLPGDTVRARVTKVQRRHAEALATEVLRPGPSRVDAPCAHYPACGGCRFQDLAYEAQLEQKQGQVRDALQRLGGLREPPLEEILPCEPEIFHYRNKMEYSFTGTPSGPALGLHKAGRWDE